MAFQTWNEPLCLRFCVVANRTYRRFSRHTRNNHGCSDGDHSRREQGSAYDLCGRYGQARLSTTQGDSDGLCKTFGSNEDWWLWPPPEQADEVCHEPGTQTRSAAR